MEIIKRKKRSYDHRIKIAIIHSQNPNLFSELKIPRTTAKNWIKRGCPEIVSLEDFDLEKAELVLKLQKLEEENKRLSALLKMTTSIMKVMRFSLKNNKVPEAENKLVILEMVNIANQSAPLDDCLEAINLSNHRYHHWLKRSKACDLDDHPTCPRSTPQKIIPPEISVVRKYVEDKSFSHFSLSSLWLFVKYYKQEISLSLSSWFRVIHQEELRRPSRKKYYVKLKNGIKASFPNQIWHIDISVFRINETKFYIQAIRDNFSRLILSHKVSTTYGGAPTKELIHEALAKARCINPQIMVDKGIENLNQNVDELVNEDLITRIIAQVDVKFSNSLIESFFHQLKNRHLYFQDLKNFDQLKNSVDFYVKEHNEVIPMINLNGLTPKKAYELGSLPEKDTAKEKLMVKEAINKRINYHMSLTCRAC